MTKLYLVRHGQTQDNAAHIMQGQSQGELNTEGIKQAEDLRDRMAGEPIDAFVSSDLKRSIDTCRIIASAHGNPPIDTTPLLRERDWGSFTGRFIPSLKDAEWPDDVETIGRLKSRAQNFITYIKTAYPNQTVLAVGHGIINKAIQSVYFHKPMNEIPRMENAEVRILML